MKLSFIFFRFMYVSKGNLRMDIPTFSLPAIFTCPNSTNMCRRFCYAKKAERFIQVKKSRLSNVIDTVLDDFIDKMVDTIRKRNTKYFRIHESGDFYNQEYLDKWIKIARRLPNVTFLAYTQMYHLDYSKKPDNLIIYWSVWPDSKNVPSEGLFAYVIDNGKGRLPKNQYIINGKECIKGVNGLKCNNCMYCYKGKGNVIFKLH